MANLVAFMSTSTGKQFNWRSTISYLSTAISISMVIYVLGLVAFLFTKAKTLGDQSKEKFRFEIFLRDGAKEVEIMQLKKAIDAEDFVLDTKHKDKEAAYQEYKEDIDAEVDFFQFLGENPLPENIEVTFKAHYTHPDSVAKFRDQLKENPLISDFKYPTDLVYEVHQNIRSISVLLLSISALLLLVAVALINNTIRLRVYSKRFVIRTMQLVGASKLYIIRPFLQRAFVLGLVSGLLAVIALAGSLHLLYEYWHDLAKELINQEQDILLYCGMVVIGIIITWISTFFAVSRFLRLKTEKLYY